MQTSRRRLRSWGVALVATAALAATAGGLAAGTGTTGDPARTVPPAEAFYQGAGAQR
jgi:hypothetical protein